MLPANGQLNLSSIQNEFGGSNPISFSEYYRGGAYTSSNNTDIPTSGPINMSVFYDAFKVSTPSQILDAIQTDSAGVRNNLVTAVTYNNTPDYAWLETNSAVVFGAGGAGNRYATTIDSTHNWPYSYNSNMQVCLSTSYITILIINVAKSVSYSNIYVNGDYQNITQIINNSASGTHTYITYTQLAVTPRFLQGMNVRAIFGKGSDNSDNRQQLLVLPGKWDPVLTNTKIGTGSFTVGSVLANDILYAIRTELGYDNDTTGATFSNTGGLVNFMTRRTHWYSNSCDFLTRMSANGTLTGTLSMSGSNAGLHSIVLRCSTV